MKKVLLADDDLDILHIVEEILSYEKFEVKSASKCAGLIRIAENYRPDLILLDYRMSDGNGGELCLQIKSNSKLKDVPVIIFTAYPIDRVDAKQFGCDEVIAKPFDLEDLVGKINNLLSPAHV